MKNLTTGPNDFRSQSLAMPCALQPRQRLGDSSAGAPRLARDILSQAVEANRFDRFELPRQLEIALSAVNIEYCCVEAALRIICKACDLVNMSGWLPRLLNR